MLVWRRRAARDANAMSDIITAVIALLAVAFAITLGVLLTDLWPWVRKRPNAPKGNDDA
jgi:membrane protein implicated in regulation of membrane protease activity